MRLIDITRALLAEGIDIRALQKRNGGNMAFQKACRYFAANLNGDDDARRKCGLKDLDPYKDDPQGFINAVEEAKAYTLARKNARQSRKASNRKGVEVVYEDSHVLIAAASNPENSKAAASLLKGEDGKPRCPWCIALAYPDNLEHWKNYGTRLALYIYEKSEDGRLVDAWAMVLTPKNCHDIMENDIIDDCAFSQMEDIGNLGNEGDSDAQMDIFRHMLEKTEMDVDAFYGHLGDFFERTGFDSRYNKANEELCSLVYMGAADRVRAALEAGADPNAESGEWGKSAIVLAVESGKPETVRMLLDAGADADARDPRGSTPLLIAVAWRNAGVALVLVGAGVDPNTADKNGVTALMKASERTMPEVVKALLDAGADPNALDRWGKSAI